MESSLPFMVNTSAPCVEMLTMVHAPTCAIDLCQILYIIITPYVPAAWKQALADAYLTSSFPNIVHNITFSSPVGNPPHLLHTFIPKNLPSATILPHVIEKELLNEISSGCMSGPFSVDEVHIIFNGHFQTSPVGLVKKTPGDGIWWMIRHLSKTDHRGFSTNDTLDSNDFPTLFFSTVHVANLICLTCSLFAHSLVVCLLTVCLLIVCLFLVCSLVITCSLFTSLMFTHSLFTCSFTWSSSFAVFMSFPTHFEPPLNSSCFQPFPDSPFSPRSCTVHQEQKLPLSILLKLTAIPQSPPSIRPICP